MCATCGCGAHEHDHDHAHDHAHPHDHAHAHDHAHDGHGRVVTLEAQLLAKNDRIAADNRAWLTAQAIAAFNLMSSPGAGKTTLLERTLRDHAARRAIAVIEGDQETTRDAERIRSAGARAVQINTGAGCHLDAAMISRALTELVPSPRSFLFIENVGNLVCPALFDLGERARVVIASVTEGDDKPLKYPHMFRAAELLLINKIDLLPYVDFNILAAIAHAHQVNPGLIVLCVSARTGEGMPAWYAWIARQLCHGRTPVLA